MILNKKETNKETRKGKKGKKKKKNINYTITSAKKRGSAKKAERSEKSELLAGAEADLEGEEWECRVNLICMTKCDSEALAA